ncbi:MAG: 3-methylfumaryl-CoA hydratase [Rhodospirillaceae bacterium]|nr:3-methylfumaryl-CoA hydratase [Rhodospirillaceae bacterium]
MAGWMDEAMETLRPWIGRTRTVEDDIGLMAVRRAAGTFDMDPASFKPGSELPPHWFGLFFAETVHQRDIGPDGHPNKGIVLPPIPMPRRMGAGRRVKITGRLRAGEPAVKKAEVADIVPKTGRSGDIFVLTMRHTIEQHGKTLAVDVFDAIYRPAVPAGQKTTATVPTLARTDHAWSDKTTLSNALNFRYSALTWNAHRIHYDGDYTRSEEGYPALVSNGGLSMHLMVNAALRHGTGTLTSFTARLVHPLWVGDLIEVRGEAQNDGHLKIWAADKNGVLCGEMELEFAA